MGSIYIIKSVSTDSFTQCFRLYPDPIASGAPSPSLSPPAEHRSSTQEQTSHPQSIISFPQPDPATVEAAIQGAPPVQADAENSVGSLPNVVEGYSCKPDDNPKIGNYGKPQA